VNQAIMTSQMLYPAVTRPDLYTVSPFVHVLYLPKYKAHFFLLISPKNWSHFWWWHL